jgi:general secretion pathway protein I
MMVNNSLGSYRNMGFTLIEIMVALAVIAIAVAAVMAAISGNVSNAAYIQDRTLAHWVAMNKVTEVQVAKDWPAAGTQHGESLMASQQWSWQVKVSTTEDPDVRRVDVDVFANQDQKNPLSAIVAYVGRPPTTSAITGGHASP